MRFSFEKQYPDECSNVREERGQRPALGKPGSYYKPTDFLLSVRMYLINSTTFACQIFLLLNQLLGQHFPSIPLPLLVIVVYLCRFFFNLKFLVVLVFVATCGLSLAAVSGVCSSLQCTGFSWQCLLLWCAGSRHMG